MNAGTFGLTAAVGLAIADKARIAHRSREREKALQSRAEFGLARLNEQGAALDAISAAMRRLEASFPQPCSGNYGAAPNTDNQVLTLRDLPVEVTPVAQQQDGNCEFGESLAGTVREMSARAVKFAHAKPFTGQVVVLTFHFGNSQRLSFVVDVMWTEEEDSAFVTGGSVLDVGVPCDEDDHFEQHAPDAACAQGELAASVPSA